jgi:dipeptidyl aminopeptidase/acylaminoacyl peptidase
VIPEVSEESRPVRVSPDGQWVAHILVHKVESPYQYPYELAVSPMEGGMPRVVSADAGLTVAGFEWDADSEHLIVSIHAERDSKLARLSREGGDPQILVEGGRWVQDFDVSTDGRASACVITDPSSPGELFLVDLESGATKRLSNFNQVWVESHALSRPHEIWYEGADGTDIQGWYMVPKEFDPAGSYPVAVEIHGGPQITWGNSFWHEFQVLASRGYFVFFCNPRGSSGYGLDFQLMRDKGGIYRRTRDPGGGGCAARAGVGGR